MIKKMKCYWVCTIWLLLRFSVLCNGADGAETQIESPPKYASCASMTSHEKSQMLECMQQCMPQHFECAQQIFETCQDYDDNPKSYYRKGNIKEEHAGTRVTGAIREFGSEENNSNTRDGDHVQCKNKLKDDSEESDENMKQKREKCTITETNRDATYTRTSTETKDKPEIVTDYPQGQKEISEQRHTTKTSSEVGTERTETKHIEAIRSTETKDEKKTIDECHNQKQTTESTHKTTERGHIHHPDTNVSSETCTKEQKSIHIKGSQSSGDEESSFSDADSYIAFSDSTTKIKHKHMANPYCNQQKTTEERDTKDSTKSDDETPKSKRIKGNQSSSDEEWSVSETDIERSYAKAEIESMNKKKIREEGHTHYPDTSEETYSTNVSSEACTEEQKANKHIKGSQSSSDEEWSVSETDIERSHAKAETETEDKKKTTNETPNHLKTFEEIHTTKATSETGAEEQKTKHIAGHHFGSNKEWTISETDTDREYSNDETKIMNKRKTREEGHTHHPDTSEETYSTNVSSEACTVEQKAKHIKGSQSSGDEASSISAADSYSAYPDSETKIKHKQRANPYCNHQQSTEEHATKDSTKSDDETPKSIRIKGNQSSSDEEWSVFETDIERSHAEAETETEDKKKTTNESPNHLKTFEEIHTTKATSETGAEEQKTKHIAGHQLGSNKEWTISETNTDREYSNDKTEIMNKKKTREEGHTHHPDTSEETCSTNVSSEACTEEQKANKHIKGSQSSGNVKSSISAADSYSAYPDSTTKIKHKHMANPYCNQQKTTEERDSKDSTKSDDETPKSKRIKGNQSSSDEEWSVSKTDIERSYAKAETESMNKKKTREEGHSYHSDTSEETYSSNVSSEACIVEQKAKHIKGSQSSGNEESSISAADSYNAYSDSETKIKHKHRANPYCNHQKTTEEHATKDSTKTDAETSKRKHIKGNQSYSDEVWSVSETETEQAYANAETETMNKKKTRAGGHTYHPDTSEETYSTNVSSEACTEKQNAKHTKESQSSGDEESSISDADSYSAYSDSATKIKHRKTANAHCNHHKPPEKLATKVCAKTDAETPKSKHIKGNQSSSDEEWSVSETDIERSHANAETETMDKKKTTKEGQLHPNTSEEIHTTKTSSVNGVEEQKTKHITARQLGSNEEWTISETNIDRAHANSETETMDKKKTNQINHSYHPDISEVTYSIYVSSEAYREEEKPKHIKGSQSSGDEELSISDTDSYSPNADATTETREKKNGSPHHHHHHHQTIISEEHITKTSTEIGTETLKSQHVKEKQSNYDNDWSVYKTETERAYAVAATNSKDKKTVEEDGHNQRKISEDTHITEISTDGSVEKRKTKHIEENRSGSDEKCKITQTDIDKSSASTESEDKERTVKRAPHRKKASEETHITQTSTEAGTEMTSTKCIEGNRLGSDEEWTITQKDTNKSYTDESTKTKDIGKAVEDEPHHQKKVSEEIHTAKTSSETGSERTNTMHMKDTKSGNDEKCSISKSDTDTTYARTSTEAKDKDKTVEESPHNYKKISEETNILKSSTETGTERTNTKQIEGTQSDGKVNYEITETNKAVEYLDGSIENKNKEKSVEKGPYYKKASQETHVTKTSNEAGAINSKTKHVMRSQTSSDENWVISETETNAEYADASIETKEKIKTIEERPYQQKKTSEETRDTKTSTETGTENNKYRHMEGNDEKFSITERNKEKAYATTSTETKDKATTLKENPHQYKKTSRGKPHGQASGEAGSGKSKTKQMIENPSYCQKECEEDHLTKATATTTRTAETKREKVPYHQEQNKVKKRNEFQNLIKNIKHLNGDSDYPESHKHYQEYNHKTQDYKHGVNKQEAHKYQHTTIPDNVVTKHLKPTNKTDHEHDNKTNQNHIDNKHHFTDASSKHNETESKYADEKYHKTVVLNNATSIAKASNTNDYVYKMKPAPPPKHRNQQNVYNRKHSQSEESYDSYSSFDSSDNNWEHINKYQKRVPTPEHIKYVILDSLPDISDSSDEIVFIIEERPGHHQRAEHQIVIIDNEDSDDSCEYVTDHHHYKSISYDDTDESMSDCSSETDNESYDDSSYSNHKYARVVHMKKPFANHRYQHHHK